MWKKKQEGKSMRMKKEIKPNASELGSLLCWELSFKINTLSMNLLPCVL